ncbi:MAG: hypothetical protein ACOZNI_34820 [Myxococcota bacterium]
MRRLAALLVGLVVAALLVEAAARLLHRSRIQVVRSRDLREADGVVLWTSADRAGLREPVCGDRPRVALFGTSILGGSGLEPEETLGPLLVEVACVANHAEPAFQAETMLARAREVLPRERHASVIWEIWPGSTGRYTRIGGAAYNLMGARPPGPLLGVLVPRSRAVEAAWSARLTTDPRMDPWDELRRTTDAALSLVGTTPILFVVAPPLHQPFADTVAQTPPSQVALVEDLHARGAAVVDLASALAAHDVSALRLDPCCHYDADGMRAVADAIRPWLLDRANP